MRSAFRPRRINGRVRLVYQAFGAKGLIRRIFYLGQLKTGLLRRRLPVRSNFDDEPELHWTFTFDLDRIRGEYRSSGLGPLVADDVVIEADRVLSGEHPLFGDAWRFVDWPPRWLVNPSTGAAYPNVHWSSISDDDPVRGDIKDVWDVSRFRFTYLLARAFALTDDDRYPQAWWEAVESWAVANPPNTGVNWRCAQETSLRAIAWCFGLSVFAEHPASTSARRRLLARLLGASVRRVRPTVGYALSQRNNHAISELSFLLSMPRRPPRRLCHLLREAMDDQFFEDGSYGQQSLVYERLALHTLSWLLAVQDQLPSELRADIIERLTSSASHLSRCSDPVSGDLANYGPNDGTNLLALSTSGHLDARPTLELLGVRSNDARSAEPCIWFPVHRHVEPVAVRAATNYITMRGPRSMLLTRVNAPARRAADSDQQAVELFIDGERVVIDPGTFRYSGAPPWRNPFTGIEAHSAARPVAATESVSLGRFLRLPMATAEIVTHESSDEDEVLVSRRTERNMELVRAVVRRGDRYAIVDRVRGGEGVVRWNLNTNGQMSCEDGRFESRSSDVSTVIEAESVAVLQRSQELPTSGWWSPNYATLEPCRVVEVPLSEGVSAHARFAPARAQHLSRSEVDALVDPVLRAAFNAGATR